MFRLLFFPVVTWWAVWMNSKPITLAEKILKIIVTLSLSSPNGSKNDKMIDASAMPKITSWPEFWAPTFPYFSPKKAYSVPFWNWSVELCFLMHMKTMSTTPRIRIKKKKKPAKRSGTWGNFQLPLVAFVVRSGTCPLVGSKKQLLWICFPNGWISW